jgi:hypothetical protein
MPYEGSNPSPCITGFCLREQTYAADGAVNLAGYALRRRGRSYTPTSFPQHHLLYTPPEAAYRLVQSRLLSSPSASEYRRRDSTIFLYETHDTSSKIQNQTCSPHGIRTMAQPWHVRPAIRKSNKTASWPDPPQNKQAPERSRHQK